MENTKINAVVPFSDGLLTFIGGLSHPVALLPPSLFELLGDSVSPSLVDNALSLLGFRATSPVSAGIGDLTANLVAEAARRPDVSLLFSACPQIKKIAAEEFPRASACFSTALPPADRVALRVREAHPDATLFFLSPCSSRAKALSSIVDYAIPLKTLYPALLDAIAEVSGRSPVEVVASAGNRNSGSSRAHNTGATGRVEVTENSDAIRSWLSAFESGMERDERLAGPYTELVVCRGGCSCGDWAPVFS
jgi:hypothetical protein